MHEKLHDQDSSEVRAGLTLDVQAQQQQIGLENENYSIAASPLEANTSHISSQPCQDEAEACWNHL